MKSILVAVLCVAAFSANLRSKQTDFDFQQILEQAMTVLQQAYNSVMKDTERQFVRQMYPDNADTVQGELDTCEDQLFDSFMTTEQAINADFYALFGSCNSGNTDDLANQLMQDTLTLMFVNAGQCTFSVDFIGDVNRLAVASAQQQFRFSEAFLGSLQSAANASVPLEPTAGNIQPYIDFVDAIASGLGISQNTISQADSETQNVRTTSNQIVNDIAATDDIPNSDAVEFYNANVRLGNDYAQGTVELVRQSADYVSGAVQAICSIVLGQ